MQWKVLHEHEGRRTAAAILETGEEVMRTLRQLAHEHDLGGTTFTAIGAFQQVVLGFFDWETKTYERITFAEQLEVISLVGDVGRDAEDNPALHAHVVLGRRDGTAHGGHLIEAHVRPTLEVVLTDTPTHLRRRLDPSSGLHLIRFL